MVMGKTGMVRVLCLLRFHPKGNLCGVKNKVQINRPFHSYVQVLVKTSKIIYFNTVEKKQTGFANTPNLAYFAPKLFR